MRGVEDATFRSLVETAPLAVAIHVDGRVVYANRTAEDILGVAPGRAVDLSVLQLVHPDHVEVVQHRVEHLLGGRALPGSLELTLLRPDGEEVRIEAVSSRVELEDGRTGIAVLACDVTARARREAQITHLATHDGLTGLPNRLLLLDRLEQTLARIGRGCAAVLVLFLDLDGFKRVNDAHGHAAGDEVLREVAHRLRASVRAADTVARLAGDEFVVVAELSTSDLVAELPAAEALEQRITAAFREPFAVEGVPEALGVSIGSLLLDQPGDAHDVLVEADRRMYADKRAGVERTAVP